jgi:uncharacterized membrane protein SpoIIM required for sporulation
VTALLSRRTVRGSAGVLAAGMAAGAVAGLAGLGALDPQQLPQESAGAILSHNLVFAAGLVAGVVTFGLTTVLLLAFGGWLIGGAIGASLALQGVGATALGLLPHASAGLAALILLGAVGLSSLDAVLVRLRPRPQVPGGARAEVAANLALGSAGVVLLLLAAVLEAAVTSHTATL